jgi:tryptophan-rich sensory protein
MRRIEKLSKAQRVVVVIALGLALLAVGNYLISLGQPRIAFGWTGYAPLSTPSIGQPGWLSLIVWLALASLWAVASIRLLRPPSHEDSDRHPK